METINWFIENTCIVLGIFICFRSMDVAKIMSITKIAITREITETSEKIKNEKIMESILFKFSYGAMREIFSFLYTYWDIEFDTNHKTHIPAIIHIFFREKASIPTSPRKKNTGNKKIAANHPINIKP